MQLGATIGDAHAFASLPAPKTPMEAHAAAMARGADCTRCTLWGCRRGPVMPTVVPHARMTIGGEAPGGHEVAAGQGFVGASGRILDEALEEGGVERAECTVSNTILCQPPQGRTLDDYLRGLELDDDRISPLQACSGRLARDLADSDARVLLAIGGTALRALAALVGIPYDRQRSVPGAPRAALISKQHGAPIPLPDGRVLCSALHPSFAFRDKREYLPVIRADIARAARIALRGGSIEWAEPPFILAPTADVAVNLCDALREAAVRSGRPVTLDLETDSRYQHRARIRCIGLGGTVNGAETIGVVPFRRMNGGEWWASPSDKLRVARAVQHLLHAAPLAGHNVYAYDSAILLRTGLLSDRHKPFLDTVLLHHDSEASEQPHDLGFVITRLFEAPRHKDDADSASIEGVDDVALHTYCAKDVLGTMRACAPLELATRASGMLRSYEVDSALAPHFRDMGELGLVYDQDERLRHFRLLYARSAQDLEVLRQLTERPDFNPLSVPQVQDQLFERWGLTPVHDTEGRPWTPRVEGASDPEDAAEVDPSTDDAALQELLARGGAAVPKVAQFIAALRSLREARKMASTYVCLREIRDAGERKAALRRRREIYRCEVSPEKTIEVCDTALIDWEDTPCGRLPVLHPTWKLHVIPTGRVSVTPNIQAWPRAMRSMLTAPPGYLLAGADMDQIEARLFAMGTGDEVLLDAFAREIDVHMLNYASMEADDLRGAWIRYRQMEAAGGKKNLTIDHLRTIAKRFLYALSYGAEEPTLYATLSTERLLDGSPAFPGLCPADVHRWFLRWHANHPWTQQYFDRLRRDHRAYGYIGSVLHGRKNFLVGGFDRNVAANFGQQAGAAAIVNDAMLRIVAACPHRGWGPMAGPLLQGHDSIYLQVPEARAEEARSLLIASMTTKLGTMNFPVSAKRPARRWGDL